MARKTESAGGGKGAKSHPFPIDPPPAFGFNYLALSLADAFQGPGAVFLLQAHLVPGTGGAGVGAEPAAQDLGEAVSVVAWEVDDVQGGLHELGFVGDAFDLEGGLAQG